MRQMVLDTSDARGCVISIPLEIVGGTLPSLIANQPGDLRWSKNTFFQMKLILKIKEDIVKICLILLHFLQLQVLNDKWEAIRLLSLSFLG